MAPRDPSEFFEAVRDGLSHLFGDTPRSQDERLLVRAKQKRKRWDRHKRAFFVVGLGLVSMNLVVALFTGFTFPWAAFPLIGWGMGFALHGLAYRSWQRESRAAIRGAESRLGLSAPSPSIEELEASASLKVAVQVDGIEISDPTWRALVEACRRAVRRAEDAIGGAKSEAVGAVDLRSSLSEGRERLERLAAGAERIRLALIDVVPRGLEGLSKEISRLDVSIASRGSDDLQRAYLENRTLLIARRAKIEALQAEAERMRVTAEGFVLAAENVRLDVAKADVASLDRGQGLEGEASRSLAGPIERLEREVAVLHRVEAELKQL